MTVNFYTQKHDKRKGKGTESCVPGATVSRRPGNVLAVRKAFIWLLLKQLLDLNVMNTRSCRMRTRRDRNNASPESGEIVLIEMASKSRAAVEILHGARNGRVRQSLNGRKPHPLHLVLAFASPRATFSGIVSVCDFCSLVLSLVSTSCRVDSFSPWRVACTRARMPAFAYYDVH